jgi:hypothetical protein
MNEYIELYSLYRSRNIVKQLWWTDRPLSTKCAVTERNQWAPGITSASSATITLHDRQVALRRHDEFAGFQMNTSINFAYSVVWLNCLHRFETAS